MRRLLLLSRRDEFAGPRIAILWRKGATLARILRHRKNMLCYGEITGPREMYSVHEVIGRNNLIDIDIMKARGMVAAVFTTRKIVGQTARAVSPPN